MDQQQQQRHRMSAFWPTWPWAFYSSSSPLSPFSSRVVAAGRDKRIHALSLLRPRHLLVLSTSPSTSSSAAGGPDDDWLPRGKRVHALSLLRPRLIGGVPPSAFSPSSSSRRFGVDGWTLRGKRVHSLSLLRPRFLGTSSPSGGWNGGWPLRGKRVHSLALLRRLGAGRGLVAYRLSASSPANALQRRGDSEALLHDGIGGLLVSRRRALDGGAAAGDGIGRRRFGQSSAQQSPQMRQMLASRIWFSKIGRK